jgi:glutamate dehydrogenase
VELLWNGGIGTYVKAEAESHADAGDKANDGVRVDGSELRAKVLGEGGNLGVTQRGRIEFALAGGRVNTDAIDNSGGVDCSDREVNIKILLDAVVEAGDLTEKQRNELLVEMTDEVAALGAAGQLRAVGDALARRGERGQHGRRPPRFLRFLESRRNLRPRARGAAGRRGDRRAQARHGGLTRPELAVLLAYSKIDLYARRARLGRARGPVPVGELERYFPRPLPERFGTQMRAHRLRREIVATQVVNNMLHGGGTTFAFRLHEETGAPASQIARAYAVRARSSRCARCGARSSISTRAATLGADRPAAGGAPARGARVALAARQPAAPARHRVDCAPLRPGAMGLYASITRLLSPEDAEPLARRADELRERGVPEDLATACAALPIMFSALDIVVVADESELDVDQVAAAHFRLGSQLGLHWLRDRIVALPRDDRWRARARAALRDDLYAIHRAITSEVLRSAPSDAEPAGSWTAGSTRTRPPSAPPDDRRHPERPDLRPDDAAGGRARDAQPHRAVSSALTSHSRRAASSLRAAPLGFTIFGCPRCSPMPSGPM